MGTGLSPEQVALRDSAVNVVDQLGPRSVIDLDDMERSAKLDAAVAGSGWRELRSPTEDGSPLASAVEVAIVAEELGRGIADVSFLGPTLAAELRRLAGAPSAASRETVALTSDVSQIACGGGSAAVGALAVDARGSDRVLLVTRNPAGYQLAIGASEEFEDGGVDLTRPVAALLPESVVPVPDQCRVIPEGEIKQWAALGISMSSADLVGVMRGAVRLACEYATSRRQYGAAIGSFQSIQHLLADAFVSMEGSRSVALHAAWAVDALPPEKALAAASISKAYCARAARAVCEAAIQVHGGIGNTWDCLAHVYLRRALHSSDILGGVGASLARVRADHGIGETHGLR